MDAQLSPSLKNILPVITHILFIEMQCVVAGNENVLVGKLRNYSLMRLPFNFGEMSKDRSSEILIAPRSKAQ